MLTRRSKRRIQALMKSLQNHIPTPEEDLGGQMCREWDALRALVNTQAEDEGLWCLAQSASEAYLQQELRKLHAAIEGTSTLTRNQNMQTPTTDSLTPDQLADAIDAEVAALRYAQPQEQRGHYDALTAISLSVRNLSVRMVVKDVEQDVA